MLARLSLKLSRENLSWNMSSLFHGFLMENLDWEYGEYLHSSALLPYSLRLTRGEEGYYFLNISALNSDACRNIIEPVYESIGESIFLKGKNLQVHVTEKSVETEDYGNLIKNTVFSPPVRKIIIRFMTPTAFKSEGEYVFYPTVGFILSSLCRKYSAAGEGDDIYTPELLGDLEDNVKITSYNLRSSYFSLEGVRIPAFTGWVKFNIGGPGPLVGVVNLLAKFGEFSGVGIKTSLGMGCIRVEEDVRKI